MRVKKAVIPAAGLGTRFLPASKVVAKELVTVVDRPVIQYSVEELARAGITEVHIVISAEKQAVVDHFKPNPVLEKALEKSGKVAILEELRDLNELADVRAVIQDRPLGLGHAVACAREAIGDEPFAVLLPDELFDPKDNYLAQMVSAFEDRDASMVAVLEVPHEQIKAYGSVAPAEGEVVSEEIFAISGVVEKPDPKDAPSDFALCGRYVLDPEVFDVLEGLEPGAGGEIQLADALGVLGGKQRVFACKYQGRRWDVGTKQGYLRAGVALGAEHEQLGPDFRAYLSDLRLG